MINKTGKALISIVVIILGALSIIAPADVEGSEFHIQPSILLSEEYNDNVLLTAASKSDDYITSIAPSLSLVYLAPNWDWKIDYTFNYQYYARRTIDNGPTQTLNLLNTNRIATDVLFLEVQDQYSRVSLDLTRDFTQVSNFVNQSDRNLLTINPYFLLKPLSQMTVTTGYIFIDTWYKDQLAIDRTDHVAYADVRQGLSPRLAVTAGVRRTWDENIVEGYTQDDIYLGLYYEFSDVSTATVKIGKTWFDYEKDGRVDQIYWDAIINQRYSTISVSYETGIHYLADPFGKLRREDRYLATVRKEYGRTSLMVSGGLIEYRDAQYNNLENTSYLVRGSVNHAITAKSRFTLDLSADRLDDNQAGTSLETYRTGVRFEYLAQEQLTLAIDYRYTNVYSPDISSDTYDNNRFTVELRKVF